MKTRCISVVLIVFFISFISKNSYADHNKYALIIAIGDYPSSTGWGTISSKNDVPLIKETLLNQGFPANNISYLFEAEGTVSGVTKAINELIEKAEKGDYIVVHYSGHGQQISDNNGDELDGFDESLVMYGAPAHGGDGYKGEKHFRDEDFGKLINKLRLKVGKEGQVIVILDSCHSGTATRGVNEKTKVRGTKDRLVLDDTVIKDKNDKSGEELGAWEVPVSRGVDNDMAPFVLFSGARADESNYEYNGVGSLSYAISQAFAKADSSSTFSSIFADVLSTMANIAPYQTPEIEGDINNKVFNGGIVPQDPYYVVKEIVNVKEIEINGGQVTGVNVGDVVGIYKSGTSKADEKNEIGRGKVTNITSFTALVELDKETEVENKTDIWAFVIEKSLNNIKVTVKIEDVKNKSVKEVLLASLNSNNTVIVNDENPDIVVSRFDGKTRGSKTIYVRTYAEGVELGTIKSNEDLSKKMDSIIEEYSRGKFFKQLELDDENYKVTMELIPVVAEKDKYGRTKKDANGLYIIKDTLDINDFKNNGVLQVGKNDYFIVKVTNEGKRTAFFNIIDIQPDGVINAFLPDGDKKISIDELKIEAGKSLIIPGFIVAGFNPPYGKEVFKIISNGEAIDMSPVITSRGEDNPRGGISELGKVVTSTYRTRGPNTEISNINSKGNGSTINYVFEIIKD